MKSLIFGAKSSPCSAIYIKDTISKQYQKSMPEAASAIMNSSYVDDFLHRCESDEDAIKIIHQVSEINSKGGFHMHEWVSNHPRILTKVVPPRCHQLAVVIRKRNFEEKPGKVLSLQWNTLADTYSFNIGLQKIPLELISGFSNPFVIQSMIIMQEVWGSEIGWDATLKDNEDEKWKA